MPNWCENRVNISGDVEDIKAFRDKAFNDGVFHFNNLIPMPKELDISSGSFAHLGLQTSLNMSFSLIIFYSYAYFFLIVSCVCE